MIQRVQAETGVRPMGDESGKQTLLHVFPSFEVGGSQMRFATLANRLAARYRHQIIAMDNRSTAASLLASEVEFSLLPYSFDKRRTLANLRAYRRTIRTSSAERLFTYNWGATEWALANLVGGIPHVHVEDGFGPEEATQQIPRRVWFRRLALARATKVVLPSRTLEAIARDIWRLPPSKIAYVPNGVDCARFDRGPDEALCAQIGIDRQRQVVGTVAGLRPEKNVGRLIRAFAQATAAGTAQLVIVGAGAERERLVALARDLGIGDRVCFAGHQPQVERLLRAFDVYAISSDTEQMPISLVEAMAAGLPVAAVNVGDIARMVASSNGPFVTPVDDSALAGSIKCLLGDTGRAARIGADNAAKARVEFSEAAMVAAYDSLYAGRPLPQA